MLSLRTFKNLCKKHCPEWNHFHDWKDGEFWVSFSSRDDLAIGMYHYKANLIFLPCGIKLGVNKYFQETYIYLSKDGEQIKNWEDGVIIDASDKNAKKQLISTLEKLHQDYKKAYVEKRESKIKEDF